MFTFFYKEHRRRQKKVKILIFQVKYIKILNQIKSVVTKFRRTMAWRSSGTSQEDLVQQLQGKFKNICPKID
jgi:hypothetical protein